MSKTIKLSSPTDITDGVLITSETLVKLDARLKKKYEIKHNIQSILEQAKKRAFLLEKNGYLKGYEAGMLEAFGHVIKNFDKNIKSCNIIKNKVKDQIREVLIGAFDNHDLIIKLFDEWMDKYHKHDRLLNVILPVYAKKNESGYLHSLRKKWSGDITLDYHNDERYIISSEYQIGEFSPGLYADSVLIQIEPTLETLFQSNVNISKKSLEEFIKNIIQNRNG